MLRVPTTMQRGSLEMRAAVVCAHAYCPLCDCMVLVRCTLLYSIEGLSATIKSTFIHKMD